MDRELASLGVLAERACRGMNAVSTAREIQPACDELHRVFDVLTARVPNGDIPIAALQELQQALRDAESEYPSDPRSRFDKHKRVYRWSQVAGAFSVRLWQLRYEMLAAQNPRTCDCDVLVALGSTSNKPSSQQLRSIGYDYDGYYNGDAYACDECATRWCHKTEDTESQHVEWWEPHPATWEPAKPP